MDGTVRVLESKLHHWNITKPIGGLESFEDLVHRHASKKLATIDARESFYRVPRTRSCPWISHIFTPIVHQDTTKHRYTFRHQRQHTRYIYNNKILQNVIASKIRPESHIQYAPWKKDLFWTGVLSIGDLIAKISPFLASFDTTRRSSIQNSFYRKFLKGPVTIDQEIKLIGDFRESQKNTWNFLPE